MAFFKQLRLLLKHKILLRRRQPTTLLLEIFWPAFVFLTILVARWHFPPTFRQTCYYNAKALPSSGMINLLQSYVCNLENPCLNRSEYQEVPNYQNASIHTIVDQLLPLLTNKNVTQVINDLPKGIRLIAAIIDTLSIPSVQRLLEEGLPLKHIVRPTGWKRVEEELNKLESTLVPFYDRDLVNYSEYNQGLNSSQSSSSSSTSSSNPLQAAVPIRTYDILVNANLNLMQFGIHSDSYSSQSFRSFRDVICDHSQLEKFLTVPHNKQYYIKLLSRHLCLLERKDLYRLFDLIQENIDFAKILEQLSLIFQSVGLHEHQKHLDNIISMIVTIDRANILPSMNALRNTSWMYDVPSLFDVLRSGEVDVATMFKIFNDIEPIFNMDDSLGQNEKLNDLRQRQRIEYLMHLYDSDDSTLKSVADSAFSSTSSSTINQEELGNGLTAEGNDQDYGFDQDESNDSDDSLLAEVQPESSYKKHRQMTILQSVDDLEASETSRTSSSNNNNNNRVNLLSIATTNYPNDSLGRKFLPKLLANMDKFIDGAEKFTKTPQWNSLLGAFQGLQMMLEMADSDVGSQSNQFSSASIEKFILNFPKNIQAMNNFFNSIVPEKFQPLVFPLFNLLQRIADSMLQHLSGAFTRALNEDKIYYFDKLAQLLIASMNNGTLPRKCMDMQRAMCDFDTFQSVFINNVDEETGEVTQMVDEDIGTLQGIQELGCIFFGRNYFEQNVEESTPILAKLYYTLSTLNDTNQLSSSLAALTSSNFTENNKTTVNDDNAFWNNFTSRMLEVYLLATKSVNANTWARVVTEMSIVWRRNRLFDRIILGSRILQLMANCFTPERIMNSPIWFSIQRKNIIINEVLNLILDEINQAVETEALKVQQLSMGSPTLHSFLQKNLHILPVLIDSVLDTLFLNLPKFLERVFQYYPSFLANWPCNRFSLAEMLAIQNDQHRAQIYEMEDFLCRQYQMNEGDYGRIIDELMAPTNNQSRGAPLIRVLQNKSNNLSMIYEHVPRLDWVEAATSVSLIKESAEKLLFANSWMVWFPEVEDLDSSIRNSMQRANLVFSRFYNQGTAGLFTYLGDIVTPFAIRYMILNETFNEICDYGISGVLMAPVVNDKEWRCFFVSLQFASYSFQHLLQLFNEVLRNFLNDQNHCQLFNIDGEANQSHILFLLDHIPEIVELILNEVSFGDINRLSSIRSLHELICDSNINLDLFGTRHQLYAVIRQNLCRFPSALTSCVNLTMPNRWAQAFDHLNHTWYSQSLVELSNKSAFVDAYKSFYDFLSLFGQFSPRFINRLMMKFESNNHGQQFIQDLLKRLNRMEPFRQKRLAYAFQSVFPELHTILFNSSGKVPNMVRHHEERRDLIMAFIYALEELPTRLRLRYKLGGIHVRPTANDDELLQADLLESLLDWIDAHLLIVSETFLQTIALDTERLSRLFVNKFELVSVWRAFCRSPVSQHFVVDNNIINDASKAQDEICSMDFNLVYTQWFRRARPFLANYTDQELVGVFLTKIGSSLDLVTNDPIYKRDLLKLNDWDAIFTKLNRLMLNTGPESWIMTSTMKFLQEFLVKSSLQSIQRMILRLKCGLDTIPQGGLSWESVPQVYRNKTEIMSVYSTLNSAFTLASVGLNTFLTQSKFYNHLQMSVKHGRSGFCHLKTEQDFQEVFAIVPQSSTNEIMFALKSLQAFICHQSSNFWKNLNPVSVCFDSTLTNVNVDHFQDDLQSLAIQLQSIIQQQKNEIDFEENQSIPPILDVKQWNRFFKWWAEEVTPYPNSRRTLLMMRLFQMIDVLADQHVIWKSFYRLTYLTSEMFAYSLRALQLTDAMYPMKPEMKFSRNKLSFKVLNQSNKKGLSSLLTSTVSNLIFPEVNHFITFATFRQLRWIRHISHFFAQHPGILHDELCPTLNNLNNRRNDSSGSSPVIVDDDFNDLLLLLCHNHPSDWIYSLTFKSNLFNIKASPRPKFISHRKIRERIGKLTQVLARMLDYNSDKNNQKLDHVVSFLKLKQLESIENVMGTGEILIETIVASQNKSQAITLKEMLKTSWRSVPALLDAVDQYICSYKKTNLKNQNNNDINKTIDSDMEFSYRPKAPDMKVIMCQMPHWNFDQAYSYLSKHLDLKNLLLVFASSDIVTDLDTKKPHQINTQCVTPLRFLSRWIDVGQDIVGQMYSTSFWSEVKSCRKRYLISLLASTKSSNTFLVRHSLRYVRFMNKLLTTIDKFSHENKGVSWNNVRQLWQTFSFFILNQVPAYVPITDIVRNDVNLPEYLNATLDRVSTLSRSRAKQAIRLLTDSMLDINAISWHNFSNIALKEMICKQKETVKFLDSKNYYLPIIVKADELNHTSLNNRSDQESLYETLCQSSNLMPIIDSLMAVIDQDSINSQLSKLQRVELAKNNWINDVLMPEMTEMVNSGVFADINQKVGIIHNPNQIKTESSSQKGINHLLISFVSMTRAKNFNTLYNSIKQAVDKLSPKFNDGPIIDSLTRILEGLQSLKDLSNRGLFQIKYRIADLLVNAENVQLFLGKNLRMDQASIGQILNSTIDLSEFIEMSARVSFDSSAFCNQTLLYDELKLELPLVENEPMPSQEAVTNVLCTLSVTEDFKFNNQILNQLVIRKLTFNVINLIQNSLLKKAKVESSQIGKALNAIKASSAAMPSVKSFIRNMSISFDQFNDQPFGEDYSIHNLSLTHASNMLGKIVCGGSSAALNREIKLLKVKVQQPRTMANEISSFTSDFCIDGYKQIMQIQGGPVIWNFLKPIFVGKILYTPKAPVTDMIMAQMNTTLRFMPRIIEMLHAWSQTLSSLETFYLQSDVNNRMNHVKHLIESVFINGEADGLFDDIDTFDLIEKMTRSGNVLAIVKLIGQIAQCASFDRFVGLDNELELEEHARNLTRSHQFIAGIVFAGNAEQYQNKSTFPKTVHYKIRIDIDFVPSTKALKARIWEPGPRDHYLDDMKYLHGFIQIQEMIDRSIMAFLTNRTSLPIDPEVHLQQQPYLCYGIDKYGNYIRSLTPLITTMAWIFLIAHLIREHVLERELHLEEVMRVMGLKSGVAWLAWFIIGITVMAFATFWGILLLYIGQLIPASDPMLLFIFYMVFNVSLLMFCYMISAFFRTATIAALSGIVAYLASFLPFMVAITLENEMSFLQKIVTCFSMSTSFCFGMMYMTRFEVQGVGMQWNNLWHSPMQGDTMNVGTAMIMMAIDSVIYFLIAWYISHIHPPGNNARRYPWLFFLSYSYWKNDFLRAFGFGEDKPLNWNQKDQDSLYIKYDESDDDGQPVERKEEESNSVMLENDGTFNIVDPEEWKSLSSKAFFNFTNDDNTMIADGTLKTISGTLTKAFQNSSTLTRKPSKQSTSSTISRNPLGMEINGLYVIYNERSTKSKHIAVSNLNLNLKEGQITTILGRNGAGKTTTINVLTGQMQPTSGTVSIYGYRIPEEFGYARRLLGYCPQYNTLFNDLTVREHLIFFSELKGLLQDPKLIENDVDEILHNMGLWNLQHQLAKHLSGGLKRRLCVALAFVGGSKLIILDEPTASVDPVARRRIWDLIVQQKRQRTILLTTHHMDEAEILSDEVAVIYRGKLLCIGSPLLLKSKYGCGYRLTVSRQGRSDTETVDELGLDQQSDHEQFNGNSLDSRITLRPRSDVEKLMAFTKCLIPNASFVEDNNGEVILSLPQYDDHGAPHDYATFFRCFDSNIRTLGFGSYGVTSTTLEEVFLTLCSLEELNMPVDEAKLAVARRMSHSTQNTGPIYGYSNEAGSMIAPQPKQFNIDVDCDNGIRLKARQIYALFSKRFLHMIRDWKLLFCTLFLPCLFIAFAMAMTLIKPSFAPDPALPLTPHIYGYQTVSYLHNHPKHGNYTEKFRMIEQELVDDSVDQSVDCMPPRDKWRTAKCPIMKENKFESPLPSHLITLKGKAWNSNSRTSCKCDECFHDIKTMVHFIPPPIRTTNGWIYNLSKMIDVNQFLLRTQPEFMDRRWGGWSFRSVRSQRSTNPKRRVVKVWYDNNGFHTMPSYLNSLNNALLRANLRALGANNASQYRLVTYSHPLHVRSNQIGDQSVMQQAGDAGIAIIILVGFIFIPTSFVFYIVRERICEEKHLQKTFGVGPLMYWLSSLFWDVTILVIAIGFASAIISFFRLPIYMSRLNLPAILTLLFFFGWAMINLVYLLEKFFDEPSLAFMGIYCLALFIGIHTMVMRLMIDVFKLIEITPTIYRIFEKIAVFFPPYLLLSGIVDVHRNQLFADIFTLFDQDAYVNPFAFELLGKHFTIFAVQGIVFFLINLAIECDLMFKIKSMLKFNQVMKTMGEHEPPNEDSDVAEERRRVHTSAFGSLPTDHSSLFATNSYSSNSSQSSSSSPKNISPDCHIDSNSDGNSNNGSNNPQTPDILRVFNVTKLFDNMFGYRSAVNNITFSVPRGECFGLLGVNGAGKTTLFRIITGQVKATAGETMFNGRDIHQALANNNQSIGYCPQADALDSFLTPIEHLTIYAHLRGIPRRQIAKFVKESIDKFQLQSYSTMPVQSLSRGNRRKLCLALAMLGRPQLILLDEPTSGLDPQSRRHVCQNIQDAIRDRRSILLTSHSMEECDILCSRLAIMVNGRFKCIGSPQYLKHKFGTGYIITLRLSEIKANFKEVVEFMQEHFPQSVLRAHHHTMLEFNLPTNDILLSTIFEVLQKAQMILSLQDYSVSQTTLDQVFVSFASQQVNDFDSESSTNTSANNNNNNGGGFLMNNLQNHLKYESPSMMMAHNAKANVKKHASLLMSLCREKSSSRDPTIDDQWKKNRTNFATKIRKSPSSSKQVEMLNPSVLMQKIDHSAQNSVAIRTNNSNNGMCKLSKSKKIVKNKSMLCNGNKIRQFANDSLKQHKDSFSRIHHPGSLSYFSSPMNNVPTLRRGSRSSNNSCILSSAPLSHHHHHHHNHHHHHQTSNTTTNSMFGLKNFDNQFQEPSGPHLPIITGYNIPTVCRPPHLAHASPHSSTSHHYIHNHHNYDDHYHPQNHHHHHYHRNSALPKGSFKRPTSSKPSCRQMKPRNFVHK